jgi:acyl carrier protein
VSAPLEGELLSKWQQVLKMEQIGIQDDFLALGGNSIQAARILTRVNERFEMDLQISDIFTISTVTLMADLIQKKGIEHD